MDTSWQRKQIWPPFSDYFTHIAYCINCNNKHYLGQVKNVYNDDDDDDEIIPNIVPRSSQLLHKQNTYLSATSNKL